MKESPSSKEKNDKIQDFSKEIENSIDLTCSDINISLYKEQLCKEINNDKNNYNVITIVSNKSNKEIIENTKENEIQINLDEKNYKNTSTKILNVKVNEDLNHSNNSVKLSKSQLLTKKSFYPELSETTENCINEKNIITVKNSKNVIENKIRNVNDIAAKKDLKSNLKIIKCDQTDSKNKNKIKLLEKSKTPKEVRFKNKTDGKLLLYKHSINNGGDINSSINDVNEGTHTLNLNNKFNRMNTLFKGMISNVTNFQGEWEKYHSRLSYSPCEMLLSLFCIRKCKSKKLIHLDDLYNIANERVQEFLNINTLIKKVNEIEKLKILLFNRNQYTCINYMTKPEISFKNTTKKILKIENEEKNMTGDQKIENIIKYFCGLKEINEGDINHKLLDIMHECIVNAIFTYVQEINSKFS